MEDCDSAVFDEDIDKGALEAMALVIQADHGTKEVEEEADAKKKNKLDDAKKLVALKEQLTEFERTDRPRRRAIPTALLESIQNEITMQGRKSKSNQSKKNASLARGRGTQIIKQRWGNLSTQKSSQGNGHTNILVHYPQNYN